MASPPPGHSLSSSSSCHDNSFIPNTISIFNLHWIELDWILQVWMNVKFRNLTGFSIVPIYPSRQWCSTPKLPISTRKKDPRSPPFSDLLLRFFILHTYCTNSNQYLPISLPLSCYFNFNVIILVTDPISASSLNSIHHSRALLTITIINSFYVYIS
jgi:hypothetical protein